MKLLKVGLAGVTQANFQGNKDAFFSGSVDALKALSGKLGFDFYAYPSYLVTPEDAVKATKALKAEGVDFLLVQSSTFAAGDLINVLAPACPFVGLWAIPESSLKGSNFVESTNSFCGVNMYASILSNYMKPDAIKYKWFYGPVEGDLFLRRFEITVRALGAIKKLRNSRVALIGGIAPGFNDLYFDERTGQKRLGLEIQRNHEFSEIKQRALFYSQDQVKASRDEATCGYGCISDATAESLEMHIRYYKAYSDFCREYRYDALGVSCWPKIQDESNQVACSVIAKLNQNGIPAACEGDLPGAVSMLFMQYITGQPPALMDMASFDEADQTVLMWHCGPAPECYAGGCGASLTYSYQPTGTGAIKKIGLINDLVLKAQPVTFMRVTGEWDTMFLADGKTLDGKDSPSGSRGWVGGLRLNRREIKVRDFVNTILVQGFQHHYPMMSGDITEELMEAASWLGLSMLKEVQYENYLQNRE